MNASKINGEQRYILYEFDKLNSQAEFMLGSIHYVKGGISLEDIEDKLKTILEIAPDIPKHILEKYK
jgi:hypothetical protein